MDDAALKAMVRAIIASEAALTAAVGSNLVVTGTFTTSSATVPADTGRTEGDNFWNEYYLIPLTGACAFKARIVQTFANTGGVFTMRRAFPAATGAVGYALVPKQDSTPQSFVDIWCADTAVADVTITATPADVSFPSVVVPALGAANGLPLNAAITGVEFMLLADAEDTSAAINYLADANDQINVMLNGGSWGTDDIVAWTQGAAQAWHLAASGMRSIVFRSQTDISGKVTGAGTYLLMSPEASGTRNKAIVAHGASIILRDCRTGFRIYYKI